MTPRALLGIAADALFQVADEDPVRVYDNALHGLPPSIPLA